MEKTIISPTPAVTPAVVPSMAATNSPATPADSAIGWPLSNEVIQQKTGEVFSNWGGLERLKIVMSEVVAQ